LAPEARRIEEGDLDALALGAAILGTGGGGSPYVGKLRLRELLRAGSSVTLMPLSDLPDDALVVCVGGIGAPVVSNEKFEAGDECTRALRAVERFVGRPITAVIAAEIGGANAMEPMIVAAQTGLPVVDGDGMGRAFPEVQMTTFFIHGAPTTPAALADDKGNLVVLGAVRDMFWLERLARRVTVEMGASAGMAQAPMRGDFVRASAVPDTVTLALAVGRAVLEARAAKRDVVAALGALVGAVRLFSGKITEVRRELRGGFSVGHVHLEGSDADRGRQAIVDIQNENLILREGGRVLASVPDLIMLLDADHGEPITTELLRFGMRVTAIGLPCHPRLATPEALAVVGPAAFGYPDVTYRPLADERSAHAHHPR
jgi:uncharacterized protein